LQEPIREEGEHWQPDGADVAPLSREIDPALGEYSSLVPSNRVIGASYTVSNVRKTGFDEVKSQDRLLDVVEIIMTRAP